MSLYNELVIGSRCAEGFLNQINLLDGTFIKMEISKSIPTCFRCHLTLTVLRFGFCDAKIDVSHSHAFIVIPIPTSIWMSYRMGRKTMAQGIH